MKAIVIEGFGDPADTIQLKDMPEPPPPAAGEVTVEMLVLNINPSDLLQIQGLYGVSKPPLPFIPGGEAVGRVSAVGEGVKGLAVGDIVSPMILNCWVERVNIKSSLAMKLPAGIDLKQASMLKGNPATAVALLNDQVVLKPGDWLMQNAANSAVGTFLVKLAAQRGINTLNVVRRDSAVEGVKAAGGTAVLADALDDARAFRKRVREATGGADVKLAIDAIGGAATGVMANALADGGTIVNYGLLSGEQCRIDAQHLIFRKVTLKGFWLIHWFQEAGRERLAETYATIAKGMADGTLTTPVAELIPMAEAKRAMSAAGEGGRAGKVLMTTLAFGFTVGNG
ncbi:MAG: zinc-dependent alcohol dehydrogenase family protein [Phreatobacter sp.]|uniref:zinc-dependent alcohol dehydrogenase family protein n=1 Tax=Phreatobacter sp. TaxID=1966341 RepID=UPI001A630732|nr:zinc-dependent alcohol dehydrogenase family protein [Phreatobacter sp.]MBL8571433.1 zinc-dependent alcohol dehydrogenase family protein [Phreatobacter sp.]